MWRPSTFRRALRLARHHPTAVVTLVGSLTLGLALVAAVVSLFDQVFFRPWPIADGDTLHVVHTTRHDGESAPRGPYKWSYPDYLDLAEASAGLGEVAIYQHWPMSLAGGPTEPFRGRGMFVSGNYFSMLGLRAAAGRLLAPRDSERAAPPVVVLSHGSWRRHFAADPDIVGQTVAVNGHPMTVVGVGPPGFRGTEVAVEVDLWLAVEQFPLVGAYPEWFEVRGTSFFTALMRRRADVSVDRVQERLSVFAEALEAEHPKAAEGLGVEVRPLLEASFAPRERDRHLQHGHALLAGGLLILFVCLVNVTHLLLGLAQARRQELAMRATLGASRRRLLAMAAAEGWLLCVVAGLLAWPLGQGILRLLAHLRPPSFPLATFTSAMDGAIFLALWSGVCLLTVLLAVAALWSQWRRGVASLGAMAAKASRGSRGASLLVALQVALACVALLASLLFVRSLQRAYDIPLGFDHQRLLVASLAPGELAWDETRSRQLYEQVAAEVGALPQVEGVAWSENRLLRGATWQRSVFLEGATEPLVLGDRAVHRTNVVSAGFFEVVGIPLLLGRDFAPALGPETPPVVIINRTFAETAWPGEDALGKRFRFDGPADGEPMEVVAVVADAKYRHVQEAAQCFVYLPMQQHFKPAMTLHMRSSQRPADLIPAVRRTVSRLAPTLPVVDLDSLAVFVDEDLWLERSSAVALASFGLVSWCLAILGIYGVLAHTVARQKRDLGIRRSLGAGPWQLAHHLMRHVATPLALGLGGGVVLCIGLLRSAAASDRRWLELVDLPAIALLLLLLLLGASLGGLLPFERARRINPAKLLREE